MFPIGAVVAIFYMAVDQDFEFTDTATLAISDYVGPDSYMGGNLASTFEEGAAFYQQLLGLDTPSVPQSYYISTENRRRMRLIIADGDITKGKFRLWLTYLT